jgi:hypothetical protein
VIWWGPGLQKKPEAFHAPAICVAASDAHGIVDTGTTNNVSGDSSILADLVPIRQNILLNLASWDGSVAIMDLCFDGQEDIRPSRSAHKLKPPSWQSLATSSIMNHREACIVALSWRDDQLCGGN